MAEKNDYEDRLGRLRQALDSGAMNAVQRSLHALSPAEIGRLLESLPPSPREVLWGVIDPEDRGEVLLHLGDEVREGLMRTMDVGQIVAAAEDLDIDDLADFVEDLPETVTQQILQSMDARDRARLEQIMGYEPDTAGGLMNTDTVTVRPDVSLDVVVRYLHLRGELPDSTDCLYVVDRYGHYLGALSLDRILTLDAGRQVRDVMERERDPLTVDMSDREVAKHFENLDLVSAPVVGDKGMLVGRITIDDVVDVIRDEAEQRMMRMAGLDEEEDIYAPVRGAARRRALWLGINLATAFMASWVVGLFEATISQAVALAVLMPIVASMGGIGGSQTLTLMVRGLALGQISGGSAKALLRKELSVAAINGLLWALVVAAITLFWFGNPLLSLVIALAMLFNQLCAALAGVTIPLLLKKLSIDPALAGSVILTTITDVVGFFVFLGLGALILL
ncbi:magnesium transporter [Algiphilus sp. W345]|uniref:Magnesium transporter MgtE n=1 Tax=Banduia mediterranea TaxID=3075609 RepID=A0ABU2WIP8_9GAMM|nr:magnesium transporter [Algiphilus sp. W345]MDT0497748.1 magnesium transporter [Algiphilus sp. W345]